MKTGDNLINEILKNAFSESILENQYDKVKKILDTGKHITQLSIKELQILLAYEYLKDGAEKDFVEEIWRGKDPGFTTKIDLLHGLKSFDFNL